MRTSTVALIIALVAALPLGAQVGARFADRNAVLGERAIYVLEFTRDGEDAKAEIKPPTLPASPAYDAAYADMRQSSSRQISGFNGRFTEKISTTTQLLYYVTLKQAGAVTVPAFNCELGGITVHVPPATVSVEREAPGNQWVDVLVTLKQKTAILGQPVTIAIEVLSDKPLLQRPEPEMTIPWFVSPPGFVAEAPPVAQRREEDALPITIDGKYYNFAQESVTRDGRKRFRLSFEREVTPVKTGRILLDSAVFQGVVADQVGRDVFGSTIARSTARVVKSSAPVEIEVKDVPAEGRPPSFTNAVGTFTVQLKAGPSEIKAGDPITITMSLTGRGMLESIRLPELTGFDAFTRYEPEKKFESIPGEPHVRRLLVSWLVIPKTSDVKEIPVVAFSWYDVDAGQYRTASVGPLPLKVTGTVAAAPLVVGANPEATKRDIVVRREILAHKQDFGTVSATPAQVFGALFWMLLTLPAASFVVTLLWHRRRQLLSGDAGLRRKSGASKAAASRLAEAEALLEKDGDFAAPLARALAGFIADKLALPPASVSARTVRDQLTGRTAEPALIADAEAILSDLDARRYSGGAEDRATRQMLLDRVRDLIRALDRRLK